MMNLTVALLLLTGCITSNGDEDNAVEQIQGTWRIASIFVKGEADRSAVGETVKFENGRIIDSQDERCRPLRFRVKRTEIDLFLDTATGEHELVAMGIYQLKDDKLTLCFARPTPVSPFGLFDDVGNPPLMRPKNFDPQEVIRDCGKVVLTLFRAAE